MAADTSLGAGSQPGGRAWISAYATGQERPQGRPHHQEGAIYRRRRDVLGILASAVPQGAALDLDAAGRNTDGGQADLRRSPALFLRPTAAQRLRCNQGQVRSGRAAGDQEIHSVSRRLGVGLWAKWKSGHRVESRRSHDGALDQEAAQDSDGLGCLQCQAGHQDGVGGDLRGQGRLSRIFNYSCRSGVQDRAELGLCSQPLRSRSLG